MKPSCAHITGLVVLALLAGYSSAQKARPELPVQLTEEPDHHEEMLRLFREIEVKLIAIDTRLGDAGAGEPRNGDRKTGVSDSLSSARADAQWVVTAIDRIFELRRVHDGSCKGAST